MQAPNPAEETSWSVPERSLTIGFQPADAGQGHRSCVTALAETFVNLNAARTFGLADLLLESEAVQNADEADVAT